MLSNAERAIVDLAATDAVSETAGIARLGRRTKHLVKRLRPGDIAVIDHVDLDRVCAEDLVRCGVNAVINCSASSTGAYPNMGPQLLIDAGIVLIDRPDADLFEALKDGDPVVLRENKIYRHRDLIATGELLDPKTVRKQTEQRRKDIGEALERFAQNTVSHMVEESELLAERLKLPTFETKFRDRPVLVVVRGVDHKRDIKALRPYIREVQPVLVAVDGGADALLDEGFEPSMIVGDMDSASERALRCGAELVVHAYADGRAPGKNYLDKLGLSCTLVKAPATSQDIAMLIAAEKGAELIVTVGSHFNLVEFLDKGRRGMSSTFLTRLRIGEIMVDAKGVGRLYRPGPGLTPVLLLVAVGLISLMAIVLTTPGLRDIADLLWLKLQILFGSNP